MFFFENAENEGNLQKERDSSEVVIRPREHLVYFTRNGTEEEGGGRGKRRREGEKWSSLLFDSRRSHPPTTPSSSPSHSLSIAIHISFVWAILKEEQIPLRLFSSTS